MSKRYNNANLFKNQPIKSRDIAQTRKCHADANTNGIRTKKQYVPLPFDGGHKYLIGVEWSF